MSNNVKNEIQNVISDVIDFMNDNKEYTTSMRLDIIDIKIKMDSENIIKLRVAKNDLDSWFLKTRCDLLILQHPDDKNYEYLFKSYRINRKSTKILRDVSKMNIKKKRDKSDKKYIIDGKNNIKLLRDILENGTVVGKDEK